jgi:uncharacterized protein YbjT (DUF2867 family)
MLEKPIVLITGGTGLLGSEVVSQLAKMGCFTLRILVRESSFRPGIDKHAFIGDLATGKGIPEALAGVSIIIHCASNPQDTDHVDIGGTVHLIANLDHQAFRHFIYVSIVGVDKTTYPYYQSKLFAEHLIKDSGIPFTILRATQFYEFVISQIKALRVEKYEVFIPAGLKFQPISIDDVAKELARLAESKPTNKVINLGGPEIFTFEKLAQDYLNAAGQPYHFTAITPSSVREQMFSSGINLVPENAAGTTTWHHFLNVIQSLNTDT